MPDIALSSEVRALGAALNALLGTPGAVSVEIDRKLAVSAIHRHRIGPLVHQAIDSGKVRASVEAAELLQSNWLLNGRRCRNGALSLVRAGAALEQAAIGFATFKGQTLAQQLYPDPQWRHCGDTDILVGQSALGPAAAALAGAGFIADDPVFSLPARARRFALATVRDVHLYDPLMNQKLELHARMIFSRPINSFLQSADASLRPRRASPANVLPTPDIGPAYALYILHHGASSGWTRLKWLADLLPLMTKLDDAARDRLAAMAERVGTAAAVKASLTLAAAAFGPLDLGSLGAWLAEKPGRSAIRRRTVLYAKWINAASNESPNPLNSRLEAFKCTTLLDDGLSKLASIARAAALGTSLRLLAQMAKAWTKKTSAAAATKALD